VNILSIKIHISAILRCFLFACVERNHRHRTGISSEVVTITAIHWNCRCLVDNRPTSMYFNRLNSLDRKSQYGCEPLIVNFPDLVSSVFSLFSINRS